MRTLAIRNGDLVLTGSRLGMVSGIARVQQQIGLAMRETYGNDRFHSDWGSTLPEMIGSVLTPSVPAEIRSEVTRVVRDFILRQNEQIRSRASAGFRATIQPDEMIMEITQVRVEAVEDSALVKVVLRTASNQEFSILTSPGGTT